MNKNERRRFLKVLPIDEAKHKFHTAIKPKPLAVENVPISEALGRVLAEDIIAGIDVPPFDRSIRDGYAVVASDTFYADEVNPIRLILNGEKIIPGVPPKTEIRKGYCSEIATGAIVPRGANAIVMIEDTDIEGKEVVVFKPVVPGEYIMHAGSDIMTGEVIARQDGIISARETATLSTQGIQTLKVYKKPVIAVISTGDEIVEPGRKLREGEIYDTNSRAISDLLIEHGCIPKFMRIAKDDYQEIKSALDDSLKYDMVLISGGTSKGTGDICINVIEDMKDSEIIVHGVAMKPGKPVILARIGKKPVIGLPGFPTSAVIAFHQFALPIIRGMTAQPAESKDQIRAKASIRIHSPKGLQEFCLVNLVKRGNSEIFSAYPITKSSGSITTFSYADGILEIPENQEMIEKDSYIKITPMSNTIKPSDLNIIGSQCVGLEPCLHMLRKKGITSKVMHVGSMSGLEAARRQESDISPTHLLDEKTGTYNIPFIKNDKNLVLVKGYKRRQGILYRKDTWIKPDTKLSEIVYDKKLRIINRNQGSGTRVLFDLLLKSIGKNEEEFEKIKQEINGYNRESKSHNAVAASIATLKADWGIGIESVALMYGLGFISIRDEEYDFCIPKTKFKTPAVQEFIKTIKSDEFKDKLLQLGGFMISSDIGREFSF